MENSKTIVYGLAVIVSEHSFGNTAAVGTGSAGVQENSMRDFA